MEKILTLATKNSNKVREIKDILGGLNFVVRGLDELGDNFGNVSEDAETLEGNAIIKAWSVWKRIGGWVIADDSGLFVNSLDGMPGVHSARYAGEEQNDKANNKKLIDELENKDDKSAFFMTALAIVNPKGGIRVLTGKCEGSITTIPRGEDGFGYDPLFIPQDYQKTFAQLGDEEKNKISHRARALEKLVEFFLERE
ncbi:MAG: RdgB/HAM1 family non-canonical purine NTP pyrophosphatase [Tissierellia bacterium]|nr:RdgB/HAM1 family non-canonical purine NTP pyrophosphatase [Tissierellia bacterium]